MKRNAILCSMLLAAACGSSKKPTTTAGGHDQPDGSGSNVVDDGPPPAPAPDEHLAARKAYQDPGGMWQPQQMTLPQHVQNFQAMGVSIDPTKLADPLNDPLNAVVSVMGCTASFVSPEGLIVTNHHCVQGALQMNSTPENNLVENGFLAHTKAEEKSAGPTQHVYVAQAFKDVTTEMTDGLAAIKDPVARKKEQEKRLKALLAACEKDRPELHCDINGYFRGAQYQLIEYLDIKDVRLVYVPKRSVGDYGGEIDNWAWPRHTGDFSFYRAYVGKDGKPADYSPDNVPYQPKHFLKVSTEGVKPFDFVMVAGYPGRTTRLNTASEVKQDVAYGLPNQVEYLKQIYDLMAEFEKQGGDTAIKATVRKQGAQNYVEKDQGVIDGLKKGDMLARKDALDAKVKAWAAEPGHEEYKAAIDQLEALLADDFKRAPADFELGATLSGSGLLRAAMLGVRMAEERPKADADRKPGFQDRDLPLILGGQKAFLKRYDRQIDRAMFKLMINRAAKLPAADRPWLATVLGIKKNAKIDDAVIDHALDKLYAGTKLEDDAVRLDLVQHGTMKSLKASKDPFVKLALALWPTVKAKEAHEDEMAGKYMLLSPKYADAMRQVEGGFLSPDANSTLRVTYGTVKSTHPDSSAEADWPFTTASQILKKDTGEDPFNAPKELLAAIKAKKFGPYARDFVGGDLPVNFLSDLDITGGNSGSPTLNEKGELVGLAFDGTIEGVASDVVFDGSVTRTIHCDVRYMLWVMDAVDQADNILLEMGVKPTL